VLDDQPQAATTQLMAFEAAAMSAAATHLPVKDTAGTPATFIVFFDFRYSRVPGQFDTHNQDRS
jgi:hypothetical protein